MRVSNQESTRTDTTNETPHDAASGSGADSAANEPTSGQPVDEATETTAAETDAPADADQPDVDTQSELEVARAEAQKHLEAWQRERAEFQNYKRRTQREMSERYDNGKFDVLVNLLPVIDDFERAMAALPAEIEEQSWLSGIVMIQRKFNKLLDDYSIVAIDPVGEAFDPNQHQAIGTDDDSDADSGTVTQTLQKGYMSGERILRPALVKVAS